MQAVDLCHRCFHVVGERRGHGLQGHWGAATHFHVRYAHHQSDPARSFAVHAHGFILGRIGVGSSAFLPEKAKAKSSITTAAIPTGRPQRCPFHHFYRVGSRFGGFDHHGVRDFCRHQSTNEHAQSQREEDNMPWAWERISGGAILSV